MLSLCRLFKNLQKNIASLTVNRHVNSEKSVVSIRTTFVGKMCSILFHEFAHLRHRLKYELVFMPNGPVLFKGSLYPISSAFGSVSYTEYRKLPDEVDARYHESVLYENWVTRGRGPKIVNRIINSLRRVYVNFT